MTGGPACCRKPVHHPLWDGTCRIRCCCQKSSADDAREASHDFESGRSFWCSEPIWDQQQNGGSSREVRRVIVNVPGQRGASLRACLRACVPACLRACVPACLLAQRAPRQPMVDRLHRIPPSPVHGDTFQDTAPLLRCFPLRLFEPVDTKRFAMQGVDRCSVETHSKAVHHSGRRHVVRLTDTHDAVQAEILEPEGQRRPRSFGCEAPAPGDRIQPPSDLN